MKILFLHGYRQSASKFWHKTGALRRCLKQYADITCISAPHLLVDEQCDESRSWWFTKTNSFSSKDVTDEDTGFQESLKLIQETFEKDGPFDGILGFSQGAALTALLCSLKERKEINIDFKFAIIISGFKSKCSKHSIYYNDIINIPSLHVIGESDEVICKSISEDLAQIFMKPAFIYHNGGHCVPHFSTVKLHFIDFLKKQCQLSVQS